MDVLRDDQLSSLREIYDTAGGSDMTSKDLLEILQDLGMEGLTEGVLDSSRSITFEVFVRITSMPSFVGSNTSSDSSKQTTLLKATFQRLDSDGDGFLTAQDLLKFVDRVLDASPSDELLRRRLQLFDLQSLVTSSASSRAGFLTFEELQSTLDLQLSSKK